MITIEINGIKTNPSPGVKIIEVADSLNIPIPRFCYHKKLSITANCRMCLVEIENNARLVAACSTEVADGMKIWTASPRVKAAQQDIIELLLINHPLDCPVCDQGGECELQDIAMCYGKNNSRYNEAKRTVVDQDFGPLLAADLTRCIHCMRCTRFLKEIAGVQELGAIGRGESVTIRTYFNSKINSTVAGNLIDLCPVGALTSKPYRFSARPWELTSTASVAPHDCVGSNITLHTCNNRVMRVVPRRNDAINEIWLADRDRFSYEAIHDEQRLQQPLVKRKGKWEVVSWEHALSITNERLQQLLQSHGAQEIGGLASPSVTIEEYFLMQKYLRGLGSHNIDHRLRQLDFSYQNMAPLYPNLGVNIAELEKLNFLLLIGADVCNEQPIIGLRIHQMVQNGGVISTINLVDVEFNFAVQFKQTVTAEDFISSLAGITKAVLEKTSTNDSAGIEKLLVHITPTAIAYKIAAELLSAKEGLILLGSGVFNYPNAGNIIALCNIITKVTQIKFGTLTEGANAAGAWIAGCAPHRLPGGVQVNEGGQTALSMLNAGLKGYLLLGIEPELDSVMGNNALTTLRAADFVVALSAFKSDVLLDIATVLLPITTFAEMAGTFVNVEGRWQSFTAAIAPLAASRPAWEVFCKLGELATLTGFSYDNAMVINKELKNIINLADDRLNNWYWWLPDDLFTKVVNNCYCQSSPYKIDSIVRRAKALQEAAGNIEIKRECRLC